MIAFIKEGSCASFWALLTSWSQYLWRETEHSEEQRVHHRETGEGGVGDGPSPQVALWGPTDAGWLLTGLLKGEWCWHWSTRETGLEGKVPDSRNKFLPRFSGLTGHEQLRRADTLFQGPHLRGQSLASRDMAAGSLYFHRCTGNTDLQSGLSVESAWGDWACSVREEDQKNPEEGKARPKPLAPCGNSHFHPFSQLPVLTLAALLRGAGSDLPEAPSTCHLVLVSACNPF